MLIVLVVAAGLVVVAGAGLSYVLHPNSGHAAANAALISIVLGVLGLGSLVAKMFRWPVKHGVVAPAATREQVEKARQSLAIEFEKQWEEEIEIRELHDPDAITVYWRLSELPVMDHAMNIFRPDQLTSGEVRFSGQTDKIGIEVMAAWFRGLAKRRLIILGNAGMGKTTLAMLLMLELLNHPERERLDPTERERVPVLLALSSWHSGIKLREWLAQRLGETYPILRAFGPDVLRELVNQRKVLPVLDGLDELPPQLRPHLLAQVRAHQDPLILTCRTAEYLATVTGPGGKVLTGAAVIEPMPLQAAKIAAYLERVPRERPDEWSDLLVTLTSRPDHPITQALTTPLNVWLLRKTYIDTGEDPTGLLDTDRYRTQYDITNHLLDNLVRALFDATAKPASPDIKHPFRPLNPWKPNDVSRWLAFLARQIQATGGQDLGWWRLNHSLADYRQAVMDRVMCKTGPWYGLLYGIGLALFLGLPAYITAAHPPSLTRMLITWLAGAIVFAILGFVKRVRKSITGAAGNAIDHIANLEIVPAYANFSFRLRGLFRARLLFFVFRIGFITGLLGGLIGLLSGAAERWNRSQTSGHIFELTVWIVLGLVAGFAAGFLSTITLYFTDLATTPLADDQPQTPAITLHRDLQLASIGFLAISLPFGLAFGLLGGMFGLAYGLLGAIIGAILLFQLGVLWALLWVSGRASVWYLITVGILCLERQGPRRLMAFLDDAHRVGVLRQVGALYQFRHSTLTDYFAPPSPQDLIARHTAAFSQARTGDPAAAVAVLEDLLADQLRVLGPDHPDTLATRNYVALWRAEAGDLAAAITALEGLLPDQLQLLGPDHRDTLATRHEIARMLAERGDYAGAQAEYREVLAARLLVLGPTTRTR